MAKDSIVQHSNLQLKLDISVPVFVEAKNNGKGLKRTLWRPQLNRQLVLLPPDLKPLLPDDHFVFFLMSTIRHFELSGKIQDSHFRATEPHPISNFCKFQTLSLEFHQQTRRLFL